MTTHEIVTRIEESDRLKAKRREQALRHAQRFPLEEKPNERPTEQIPGAESAIDFMTLRGIKRDPSEFPSDDTIIAPLEHATRYGGRVLLGCEETGNTVDVLPDGSVGFLPPETILLEVAMQGNTPITIL